jgi:cell division protein FtsQ
MVLAFALLVAASGALSHRFLTHSPHFSVRALRFSPTAHVTQEALAARLGAALGINLFSIDLDQIGRDVAQEPWVEEARARLELPSTIAIDVVERETRAVVSLSGLYLADAQGRVFKRANPDEAAGLPVVTGLAREQYLADPQAVRAQVKDALDLASLYAEGAARPPLGEIHLDPVAGTTLYTATAGVALRLGRIEGGREALAERFRRFDAVWAALKQDGEAPRLIYLDNRARPDRVTVKLARPREGASAAL